ncbi:uncharacterized protein LOC116218784 [Clupea harengus]|uniref:Uncharacterized protein LOC116218784 n=1 Tax=Clupea harengus TaxID=7950 RepID=A0A6P8EMM3_CLUHA|nr:uncharacterized protein LOC116218784 [Clupea harengus]
MVVLYVSGLLVLFVSIVSTQDLRGPYEMEIRENGDHPLWKQLSSLQKEMESLKCEQAVLKQKQDAIDQMLIIDENVTSLTEGSRPQLLIPAHLWLNGEDEDDGEGDSSPNVDPCYRYKILDQAWRATNYTTKGVKCDRQVKWQGWYRLYYRGRSIQMPEKCIKANHCGTHAPLWLTQAHPKIRDGVVTRKVCGHWKNKCCAFKSNPIQVKACRGNYYVYRFVKPTACHLAYCADVNTLVCGRCGSNQYCVSRDKITYSCAAKRRKIKKQVIHFFASYPGSLRGKVNRIRFSKVLVNEGKAFNKKTGVFLVPVSGVYQFYFSSQSGGSGNATNLWLVINGYWVTVSHSAVKSPTSVGSLNTYMTTLRKGAQVYVTHVTGQSWANSASNTITFGGSLLIQKK